MSKQARTVILAPAGTLLGGVAQQVYLDGKTFLSDGPGALYLNITDVNGTSPTLDITLYGMRPDSFSVFPILAIPQKTTTGFTRIVVGLENIPDNIITWGWDIGGSASPDFTFSLALVVKDRG